MKYLITTILATMICFMLTGQIVLPAYHGAYYSNENCLSVTDYDGNTYQVIKIGDQCWMAENLKVTHYPDGTPVPYISDDISWNNLTDNNTDDAYCYYNNNSGGEADTYGALYSWSAAMGDNAVSSDNNPSGVQGICPDGWHLPSDSEWKQLEIELGMDEAEVNNTGFRGTNQGSQLAGHAELWSDGPLDSSPEFGNSEFTGIPGGFRRSNNGVSSAITLYAYWWGTTESDIFACIRGIEYSSQKIERHFDYKAGGFSVRCVKN